RPVATTTTSAIRYGQTQAERTYRRFACLRHFGGLRVIQIFFGEVIQECAPQRSARSEPREICESKNKRPADRRPPSLITPLNADGCRRQTHGQHGQTSDFTPWKPA